MPCLLLHYIRAKKPQIPGKERKKMESRVGAVLLMVLIFPTLVGAMVRHYKFSVSCSSVPFFFLLEAVPTKHTNHSD